LGLSTLSICRHIAYLASYLPAAAQRERYYKSRPGSSIAIEGGSGIAEIVPEYI
jgi:hypothetical protein